MTIRGHMILAGLILGVATPGVRAGVAIVQVSTTDSSKSASGSNYASATTSDALFGNNNFATATAEKAPDATLGLHATATASGSVGSGAAANAEAEWYDTIRLTGSTGLPAISSVRLLFAVDGTFQAGTDGEALLQVAGSTAQATVYTQSEVLHSSTSGDWMNASLTTGSSAGTYHFNGIAPVDVSLTGSNGEYSGNWEVTLDAQVANAAGAWSADFGDTLTLIGVTLADGSRPEDSGYTVSFDSGIVAAAVPEPMSAVTLGLGVLGLLSFLRRSPR